MIDKIIPSRIRRRIINSVKNTDAGIREKQGSCIMGFLTVAIYVVASTALGDSS